MLKKVLNIASKKQNYLKTECSIFLYTLVIFLALLSAACDTCTGIEGKGTTPDEEIYFSATPINGEMPNIYRTDVQGSYVESVIINGMTFSSPSNNGKIAFIRKNVDGKNSLFVANYDGSDSRLIISDNDIFNVSYPILSPNGRYIAFNAGNSRIYYYDVSAVSPTFNQITGKLTNGSVPVFSNDSKFLAFIEGDGSQVPYTLKVIDASSTDVVNVRYSKLLGNVVFPESNDISLNWSADSKQLVYTLLNAGNDDINIVDIETGTDRIITVPNSEIGGNQAVISPKSDFLAVSGRDGNIWLIFIATNDLRFSNITRTDGFERNHNPKWSVDGSKIIYSSSTQLDSDIFSTLICTQLQFEVTLARVEKSFILSSNAFKGFWNNLIKTT
jgi:Tol biopolymer transport system component